MLVPSTMLGGTMNISIHSRTEAGVLVVVILTEVGGTLAAVCTKWARGWQAWAVTPLTRVGGVSQGVGGTQG